jgi:hypothetical protein
MKKHTMLPEPGASTKHVLLPESRAVARVDSNIKPETVAALDSMMLAAAQEHVTVFVFDFYCVKCAQAVTAEPVSDRRVGVLVCTRCRTATDVPASHRVSTNNSTAQLQAEVFAWCAATFKGQTLAGKLQHLWEELHELHATNYSDDVVEEIVDCGLLVMEIASVSSVVLERPARFNVRDSEIVDYIPAEEFEQNLRKKLEECKKRDWREDEQGIFRHVERAES